MSISVLRQGIEAAAVGESTTTGSGTAARRYRFAADFAGFGGHFPGDPILPAIVQMQAVVALAQDVTGTPLRLTAIGSAKFLSPIRPGDDIEIRYRQASTSAGGRYDAVLTVAERTVSSFSLELAPDTGAA